MTEEQIGVDFLDPSFSSPLRKLNGVFYNREKFCALQTINIKNTDSIYIE